jgi:hypothetical protein
MSIGSKTTFNEPCFLQKGLMLMAYTWNDNSLINFPINKYEAYTNMYIHIDFVMVVLI